MSKDIRGYWQQHVNQLQQSGLSPVEYAKQQQLSVKSLYHWRSKLLATPIATHETASPFVAINVAPAYPRRPCRIELPQGVCLELSELPAPNWLASLLQHIGQEG
jgi:hypothetical protein